MEFEHKSTGEKLNEARIALESISEEELDPEDRERCATLFMEITDLSGKYD